jgi:hypothetical protein
MKTTKKDKTEKLKLSKEDLQKKVDFLVAENKKLKEELSVRREPIEVLDKKIMGEDKRKKYISDIYIFYNNIFKNKLAELIQDQKDALSALGLPEKIYDIYRSNINCLHLFQDWFERCEVEHLGDIEEKKMEQEDESVINRLKSSL